MDLELLKSLVGFDWDEGNRDKNLKHNVEWREVEEVFLDPRLLVLEDEKHSEQETRYIAYGKTNKERVLMVIFTVRQNRIRPISARDSNRKERVRYEEKET